MRRCLTTENYREYEKLKAEIPKGLPPEEYEAAIREIAKRLGM